MSETQKRIGVLYSDGSMNILKPQTMTLAVAEAMQEAEAANRGEKDPGKFAKVISVDLPPEAVKEV